MKPGRIAGWQRLLVAALMGLGLCAPARPSLALPADAEIDLRLLVLTSSPDDPAVVGDAPQLEAIIAILDRTGTPYDVHLYDNQSPTLPTLEDGNHGRYQGIVLPLSDYRYLNPVAGGDTAQTLARYQFKYGVRVLSLYSWPADTGCLRSRGGLDTSALPLNTALTALGRTTFPYLKAGSNATNPLPIRNVWTYLAAPANPLPPGTTVKPLLQGRTADNVNNTLMATCTFTNDAPLEGDNPTREMLALTFDNSPHLLHSITLSYGLINWVARGLFLGERHVYAAPQVDDIGLANWIFPYAQAEEGWYDVRTDPWTFLGACPLGDIDPQTGTAGCEYRITGSDLDQVVAWQQQLRSTVANAAGFRLDMAFNGHGFKKSRGGRGPYPPDDPATPALDENEAHDNLTDRVALLADHFKWTSHTYDHLFMDNMSYDKALQGELRPNQVVKNRLALPHYNKAVLVTPEISGLYNADVLRALVDFGVQYVVSDTSRPTPPAGSDCQPGSWPLPRGNAGKFNCVNPGIYEVPRYPTALFYNVSTPQEWTDEYNYFYGEHGVDPTRWGYDLTYQQILDKTSDTLVSYLLTHDLRPTMFHAANLRAYDGSRSLLGDLLDATLAKYNTHYKQLPIRSPGGKTIGDLMKARTIYDQSAVNAVLRPGAHIIVRATSTAGLAVVAPLTGVAFGSASETYGGQSISHLTLDPANGYEVTVAPPPSW